MSKAPIVPGLDCAMTSLLCPEDNNSIMGFGDDAGVVNEGENADMLFLEEVLARAPLQSDECLLLLVERETEHLPRDDYTKRLRSGLLDFSARRDAIDWIVKVHAYYSFGPLCAYLSINYLDRFLSAYELPQGKSWMMQLLSVACLSLAAKMEETEVPLCLDLQVGEAKYVFESRTIQRMELLVLSTLNWRMRAITPFSFIDYFMQKINDGRPPSRRMMARSFEVILSTIKGFEFLEFRPSEIAAAVAIFVVGETHSVKFNNAISRLVHVDKVKCVYCVSELQDRVSRCSELNQDLAKNQQPVKCPSGSMVSVPRSPIGVFACLSYRGDETAVASCASSHTTPSPKRRKLNKLSDSMSLSCSSMVMSLMSVNFGHLLV